MGKAKVISSLSMDELAKNGAMIVFSEIIEVLKKKGHAVLAVPGGRSAKEIYAKFREMHFEHWGRVHIFLTDERIVPDGSPESNGRLVEESFVGKLGEDGKIPRENIHNFSAGKTTDRDMESVKGKLDSYSGELAKLGGKFDIALLGVGEDGHIAALFPNHHSVSDGSENYFSFGDSPKPPKQRMTASAKMIMGTGTAILLFMGDSKKKAMEMYFGEGKDYVSCPAKLADFAERAYAVTDMEPEGNGSGGNMPLMEASASGGKNG